MRQLTGIYSGSEIEFLRKNNNRNLHKLKKIRSIKIRSIHIILIILLFLISGFGAYKVGKFITGWKVLSVKNFQLVNSPNFMKSRVRKILRSYRGNILTIDLDRLRKDLGSIREVRDVNISRSLPSTLNITFFLRKPVFQLSSGNSIKLIDRDGVVLSERKKPVAGLIVIKNSGKLDLKKISSGLKELSKMKSSIEYVTYRNPYGLVLKLKNFEEVFYTGETRFIPRLKKYLTLKKKLQLTENKIKVVDLRFRDRYYLEFEKEVI